MNTPRQQTKNFVLKTDGYKPSHWLQFPNNTKDPFLFFESRGGALDFRTFFGLQYILEKHMTGPVVTRGDVEEAADFFADYYANAGRPIFNKAGWLRIVNKHGGRLPLRIKAVPEGTRVPAHQLLMALESTDPETFWLPGWVEGLVSQVWYPTSVATISRAMKNIVLRALEKTGDPSLIDFQVHDFGYRGSTSDESAGIGGAAHLVNFRGSDTLQGVLVARQYYDEPMAGHSIPAAEHSTITAWGRAHEADAYRAILERFPTGPVSVVSDSYDIYHAVRNIWGRELRDLVLGRDGVLVIRPDSGDPCVVVPEILGLLGEAFGFTTNAKGYQVLHPKVRVIQGDGIALHTLQDILDSVTLAGWSADNVCFGSGGGLLQKIDRDTFKFALKCSSISVNDEERDVLKDPVTDPGKRSKAGRLKLVRDNDNGFATVRDSDPRPDELLTVFENGEITRHTTFADIRRRANA